jgi:hypothetical protein
MLTKIFLKRKNPDPDPIPDPNTCSDPGTAPKTERSDPRINTASVVPGRDCILGEIKDFFLMKKSSDPGPGPNPNQCSNSGTDPKPGHSDSIISTASVIPGRDCILGRIKSFFLREKNSGPDPDPGPDPNPRSDPGTDPKPAHSDAKISATSVEPWILLLNWNSVSKGRWFCAHFMLFVTIIKDCEP